MLDSLAADEFLAVRLIAAAVVTVVVVVAIFLNLIESKK